MSLFSTPNLYLPLRPRAKFESPTEQVVATTFGKAPRDFRSLVAKEEAASQQALHLPSTLRTTVGKRSAWAAPSHHVRFLGTVDVTPLIGEIAAKRIATYDVADEGHNDAVAQLRRASYLSLHAPPSATTATSPLSDIAAAVGGAGPSPARRKPLVGHRNLAARTMEGRAVSTFSGPDRTKVEIPLSERLYPGPGHYYRDTPRAKSELGVLQGGLKERGTIVQIRSGLITELPTPAPRSLTPGVSASLRPLDGPAMVFEHTHTNNVQLRHQEEVRRAHLRIPTPAWREIASRTPSPRQAAAA